MSCGHCPQSCSASRISLLPVLWDTNFTGSLSTYFLPRLSNWNDNLLPNLIEKAYCRLDEFPHFLITGSATLPVSVFICFSPVSSGEVSFLLLQPALPCGSNSLWLPQTPILIMSSSSCLPALSFCRVIPICIQNSLLTFKTSLAKHSSNIHVISTLHDAEAEGLKFEPNLHNLVRSCFKIKSQKRTGNVA